MEKNLTEGSVFCKAEFAFKQFYVKHKTFVYVFISRGQLLVIAHAHARGAHARVHLCCGMLPIKQ